MRPSTFPRLSVSLLALVLLVVLALPASAGTRVKMKSTWHGSGSEPEVTTQEMMIEGTRLRMKLGDASGTRDVIFYGDTDEMLVIDHQDRTVMVLDDESIAELTGQISAAMKQMEAALANVPESQRAMMEEMLKKQMEKAGVQQDGAERTVARKGSAEFGGYDCQLFEITSSDGDRTETCTVEFDAIDRGGDLRTAFAEMREFASQMMEAFQASASGPFAGLAESLFDSGSFGPLATDEVSGFPVMTRRYDEGSIKSEDLVESFEEATFSAGDFEAPAEYRRQAIGARTQ